MAAYINFQPSDYYNTNLWTGNGTELAVTNVGFQSDSTLIKERNGGNAWNWFDAVRGATKYLKTSGNNAEATDAETLKSWQSTGFTVGTSVANNDSGQLYVGFNWKAGTTSGLTGGTITPSSYSINTTSGVGIYQYAGNGTDPATISHGLGIAPQMVIVKSLASASWAVGHIGATFNYYGNLDATDAFYDNDGYWSDDAPTSTVFTIGSDGLVNTNAQNYIAYVFAPVKGFSSFSKYIGNGNADGPFVYTGFRPAFVMTKRTNGTGSWCVYNDKMLGYNADNDQLLANDNGAAGTGNNLDLLSNGFKLRVSTAESNASGGEFICAAFAEFPFVSSNSKPGTAR